MDLPHFHPDYVRWCAMHVVHLGIDLFASGSTFRTLLDETDTWAPGSDDDRLLVAFQEYKSWCKENKIQQLDFQKLAIYISFKLQF